MILLVLIQRGRGGGLAGAFGGMGGQSAFGTRAGDVFTKITVVVAIIFILLSALLGVSMRGSQRLIDQGIGGKFDAPVTDDADTATDEAAPAFDAADGEATTTEGDDGAAAEETSSEATTSEDPANTDTPAEGESAETPEDPADAPASEETTEPAEESSESTSSE